VPLQWFCIGVECPSIGGIQWAGSSFEFWSLLRSKSRCEDFILIYVVSIEPSNIHCNFELPWFGGNVMTCELITASYFWLSITKMVSQNRLSHMVSLPNWRWKLRHMFSTQSTGRFSLD
jgi:hypothetical protein